jgi:hypothetical protein
MRHEPEQRPLALAHGAIAGHGAVDLALDFKRDAAAVTASFVAHVTFPLL